MANKTKRAIEDSKRKRDFKVRQKGRKERSVKKQKFENNKYVQRGSVPNKRQKLDEVEDEETKYQRVMAEEDPELERDLKEAGIMNGDDDGSENLDENEFLEHADELDLPDEEDMDDDEGDLKGDETDSDLEEYYRELGIEDEVDELAKGQKSIKKKPKKVAPVTDKKESQEEIRKRILENIITKTKENPTYAAITRVIKIVKQVFFAGQSTQERGEEEDDGEEKKKGKKDKSQAIATILLSNAG